MPIRAALFDFDGTLADSFPAITASTNHVRRRYGLPELSEDVVRQYVGLGLPRLMEDLVPTAPAADAVAAYREHHPTVMLTGTKLFPSVAETLAELGRRGIRLAVCSNKAVRFTRQLVEAFGLARTFDAVLGPEDVSAPKPDPSMLLEALRRIGIPKNDAVYVGDMAVDVHAARAAGLAVWLVPDGAAGPGPADAVEPDRMLKGFAELVDLIPPVS